VSERALVLASGSPYRQQLLRRIGLPFTTVAPRIDETPLAGESPRALAERLAITKARAVAVRHRTALVVGSDQVLEVAGRAFGKPGDEATARDQLMAMSGRVCEFHTSICLLNAATEACQVGVETTRVTMRALSFAMIADYVGRDQPLDCAGALRSEGLGIALIAAMAGEDPNALIGLPLIRLIDFLAAEGVAVLGRTRRVRQRAPRRP